MDNLNETNQVVRKAMSIVAKDVKKPSINPSNSIDYKSKYNKLLGNFEGFLRAMLFQDLDEKTEQKIRNEIIKLEKL